MPWTSKILRQFRMIPPGNPYYEAGFHGPYNKLLCTLFPGDTDPTVVPRYERICEGFKLPMDRYIFDFLRDRVDLRLRQGIVDLRPDCPLPVLHAVSAFGTRLSEGPCGIYMYMGTLLSI
ncbi:hypothetical protein EI94DRAFT_1012561 [Lactarius quietus]|nr:hypothetical protein EI94DRAFT_1012561 [Lactarius quietus]